MALSLATVAERPELAAEMLRLGASPWPVFMNQGTVVKALVVRRHGLADLVAPVRPTEKHRYPLIPMDHYIRWRRDDGMAFDQWIRVHERVGGEIIRAASAAMRVTGSVAEWERWTRMDMPQSGDYDVRGGLVPVEIDRERDIGEYLEPACWVRHRVESR